jgi:hypothetical protein
MLSVEVEDRVFEATINTIYKRTRRPMMTAWDGGRMKEGQGSRIPTHHFLNAYHRTRGSGTLVQRRMSGAPVAPRESYKEGDRTQAKERAPAPKRDIARMPRSGESGLARARSSGIPVRGQSGSA